MWRMWTGKVRGKMREGGRSVPRLCGQGMPFRSLIHDRINLESNRSKLINILTYYFQRNKRDYGIGWLYDLFINLVFLDLEENNLNLFYAYVSWLKLRYLGFLNKIRKSMKDILDDIKFYILSLTKNIK